MKPTVAFRNFANMPNEKKRSIIILYISYDTKLPNSFVLRTSRKSGSQDSSLLGRYTVSTVNSDQRFEMPLFLHLQTAQAGYDYHQRHLEPT
jgi:hypothetical protein